MLIGAERADFSTIDTFIYFLLLRLFVGLLGGSVGLQLTSKNSKNDPKDHPSGGLLDLAAGISVCIGGTNPPSGSPNLNLGGLLYGALGSYSRWESTWKPAHSLEADPAIGVSVGSGDTPSNTDGLADTVTTLVLIQKQTSPMHVGCWAPMRKLLRNRTLTRRLGHLREVCSSHKPRFGLQDSTLSMGESFMLRTGTYA